MEQRELGRTGLSVSALGFGCGAVGGLMVKGDPAAQRRAVARAIDAGIRYFDTAPSYGDGRSEENLGRVLADIGPAGTAGVVVGTKFRLDPSEIDDATAAIRLSLEASLRRMKCDRIDLLQCHNRIVLGGPGEPVPDGALTAAQVIGPVADGLRAVMQTGMVDAIGITGLGDTAAVRRVLEARAVDTTQIYFNALNPSAGWGMYVDPGVQDFSFLIDRAAERRIGVIVIRPFAAGALAAPAGRHANAGSPGSAIVPGADYTDDVARTLPLADLAGQLGLEGPLELSLRFVLAKTGVSTVLVGLSDEAQLEDAIRWAERGPLASDAVSRVLSLRG